MDNRVNSIRLEQWRQIINEQLNSGVTVKDWCSQHDITPRQFYYWKKKLIDQALDSMQDENRSGRSLPSVQSGTEAAFAEQAVVFSELREPDFPGQTCSEHDAFSPQDGLVIRYGAFAVVARGSVNESNLEKVLRVISHVQ